MVLDSQGHTETTQKKQKSIILPQANYLAIFGGPLFCEKMSTFRKNIISIAALNTLNGYKAYRSG